MALRSIGLTRGLPNQWQSCENRGNQATALIPVTMTRVFFTSYRKDIRFFVAVLGISAYVCVIEEWPTASENICRQ
ncbi:hypothetical protein PISMIDRAFT_578516 [Pisolithus microcarpus 441]|uniref:Uncharacterized protein n=1 Tax=Pisolithus microcarpus 441 TaxID=765257 RepID=A0A0C9Z329_9AGAM|nr:hypothetical protein BKA83DRAFT_578516 [Pisolithus microcarpus]KIK20604.1 hypothetical protein PISMIDRAFT_578516 [Pisolithus microcarpus 441]